MLFAWDNLQHSWNDWILNYDHKRQSRFLRQLGIGIRTWGDMVMALVFCLLAITGGYWLYGWYRDRPPPPPQYERILARLLAKLQRHGLVRQPAESVDEFLHRVQADHGISDPELERIFDSYTRIKYARGYQKESVIRRFAQMVDQWQIRT